MQNLHFLDRSLLPVALVTTVGMAMTSCSSGGTTTTTSATPIASAQPATSSAAPTSGSEPASGAGAISAIKANWATFFNAKTPTSQRLALLQDGQGFASVIKSQAGSPLAILATSKVSNVTLSGTTKAYVTYAILLSGKAALSGQQGVAIYQDGVWKVGDSSFCGLLKLENANKTAGLPAGCQS